MNRLVVFRNFSFAFAHACFFSPGFSRSGSSCSAFSSMPSAAGPSPCRPTWSSPTATSRRRSNPAIVTAQLDQRICTAIYEGLTSSDPTGKIVPGVAQSWEISPDGKTYTFHLRPDAQWSNGEPLTAGDFVESWKRVLDPATASDYAYQLFYLVNGEAYYTRTITDFAQVGVKAPDDHTLVVTLSHSHGLFPAAHRRDADVVSGPSRDRAKIWRRLDQAGPDCRQRALSAQGVAAQRLHPAREPIRTTGGRSRSSASACCRCATRTPASIFSTPGRSTSSSTKAAFRRCCSPISAGSLTIIPIRSARRPSCAST